MLRLRTISLAAALVACRAAAPVTPVRAPVVAPAPVAVTPAPAAESRLVAGFDFACELRPDGTVWCWGDNRFGALGDGTRTSRAEARRVEGLAGIAQLVAFGRTLCAVTGDGRVLRWGVPRERLLPNTPENAVLTPEALPFEGAAAEVAVARFGICARLRRGGVVCLGEAEPAGVPFELPPLREATAIVATPGEVCGRLPGGGLRCVHASRAAVDIPGVEDARVIVAAAATLVIQRADGAVVSLATERMGRGVPPLEPVEAARGATALWGSSYGWCFSRDLRLRCYGYDHNVQARGHGVRGAEVEDLPVAGLRGARAASVGERFACALADGDDAPRCWGADLLVVGGGADRREQLVPPGGSPLFPVVDLAVGGQATCAFMADGVARCWGGNQHRVVLGSGRASSALPLAREAFGAPVEAMAWRGEVGCAVAGGALRCAVAGGGYTRVGGVRVRTPDRVVTPTLPAPARSVAITQGAACASLVDGRVACVSPLAFRTPSPDAAPDAPPAFVIVPELTEVSRVVARGGLLCALSDTRPARCWGDAPEWEMLPSQSATPVELPHLGPVRSLASGENHACAVDLRGAVWCWGRGRAGQLGGGVFSERARPARVALQGEAQEVAVGRYHSCARVEGALWCWGGNARGQLGDGTTAMRAAPVRVAGVEGVTRVVADGDRTCAVGGDRRAYCWGAGDGHALGNGAGGDRLEPTPVRGE
jgi:alpha-tubulin suppressor-like RCC1 family protein